MKVISYSRLGNPVGLNPSPTDNSNAWSGQLYSQGELDAHGLTKPTVFLYPLGVEPKVTIIDDPFMCKSEGDYNLGTKKSMLLHYKLPDTCIGNDDSRLTRTAHREGFSNDWNISLGSYHGSRVPDLAWFHSTSSFSWDQYDFDQEEGLVVTRVYCGHYEWRNDLWWIPENPRVRFEFSCYITKFDPRSRRMYQSQAYYWDDIDGPVPKEAFDPAYYVVKAKNKFADAMNNKEWTPSFSYVGTCGTFTANQDELPALLDLFNEKHRFYESCWTRQYEWDWLVQHAFFDACQDIRKMNDNMLQNVLEIGKWIYSIARGGFLKQFGMEAGDTIDDILDMFVESHLTERHALKNWGSDWLSYRYAYCTTKMDIEDFSKYLLQKTDQYFKFLNKHYHQKSFGVAKRKIDGVDVLCRCELKWRPEVLDGLHTALKYIHETGFELNPYVLWDMLPFSFIVDWFIPVGDVAEILSEKKYVTQCFSFESICFSMKYDMSSTSVGTRYFRWYQGIPVLEGYMWFDEGDDTVSKQTVAKRALDVGALLLGFRRN